jgi:predicted metal-dependent enzyme (double-stranded beta helix superfamily)
MPARPTSHPTADSPSAGAPPVADSPPPPRLSRLRDFVVAMSALLDARPPEPRILDEGGALLRALVSTDDWLPPECARPDPQRYTQYLLHADSGERFSVVSFVWGRGRPRRSTTTRSGG